jgi:hypothetical protein
VFFIIVHWGGFGLVGGQAKVVSYQFSHFFRCMAHILSVLHQPKEVEMKKGLIFLLIGALLVGSLLAGCSESQGSQEKPTSHVYAFGDEHSDKGNCSEGRMSNGPLAVEVLAERLDIDLTDYAWCGAASGYEHLDYVDPLDDTTLLGQVDKFEAELNGAKADPDALYFIEIGMVDFYLSPYSDKLADEVIANIVTAVTRLAKLGAKHFMVGNLFDLSNFPGFRRFSKDAERYVTNVNAALPGEMDKLARKLRVEIKIFDIAAIEERIRSNPEQYGFKELTKLCTFWGSESGPGEICANPDEYYYWGYYYLTHHVHQILGEAMAAQVSD